jgi:hypothetical protein
LSAPLPPHPAAANASNAIAANPSRVRMGRR